jgi:hypothetical protein
MEKAPAITHQDKWHQPAANPQTPSKTEVTAIGADGCGSGCSIVGIRCNRMPMPVSLADLLPTRPGTHPAASCSTASSSTRRRRLTSTRPREGRSSTARRQERRPEHADRLRQVAGSVGDALPRARAARLYVPHQGPRQREVDGAVPGSARTRWGSTGDATVNRDAPILCCTPGPRQHRAARRPRRGLRR